MTTACLFWTNGDDFQQHLTIDERAIALSGIGANVTITEVCKEWPVFGDSGEDILYIFKDRKVYENLKAIGEIDDYIACLDGEDIQI